MARFEDYRSDSEVKDIMEKLVERFDRVFDGCIDVDAIRFITTQKKKVSGGPLKLRTVGYPAQVFVGTCYIVEMFEEAWSKLDQKRKNLAVFHLMCAFPNGAFDPQSKYYGRRVKPQIVMYDYELAVSGGVTNWHENDSASDPMDVPPEEVATVVDEDPLPSSKQPVTAESIEMVA